MKTFREIVLAYYRTHGRHDLPWRRLDNNQADPYKILVSEMMLQQTQVPRVIPKFESFMQQFPTIQTLADSQLKQVLIQWQGLGYNRRAKFLWRTAQIVTKDHNGIVPETIDQLTLLPGVGKNTAGAVIAYAFNRPAIFIETNIRTAFIHYFFKGQQQVSDAELLPLVKENIDKKDSRIWYWALMDYGTYVKQTIGNTARASTTYTKQTVFHGSQRQIRGIVLRLLTKQPMSQTELVSQLNDVRTEKVLTDLEAEGMIRRAANGYELP